MIRNDHAASRINCLLKMRCSSNCLVHKRTPTTSVKKSVSFAATSKVRIFSYRHQATEIDLRSLWYTMDEYRRIMKQCTKEANKVRRGESLRDKKYSARGLEKLTNQEETTQRNQQKQRAIENVLNVQALQSLEGICDEEQIAVVYQQYSGSCQRRAHRIGLLDAEAAGMMGVAKSANAVAATAA